MDLMNALAQAGGVEAISRELGIDQATAQSGMSALLPAVADGMRGQAAGPQGFGGLGAILGQLGGGGLLSNVLGTERPTSTRATRCSDRSSATRTPAARSPPTPRRKAASRPTCSRKCCRSWRCWWRATSPSSTAAPAPAPTADAAPAQDGGILGQILGSTGGAGGGILGSILGGLTRR